jgi:chromosome segregation ATPase
MLRCGLHALAAAYCVQNMRMVIAVSRGLTMIKAQAQANEQAATHQQALRSVQEQLHASAKSLEEASAKAKSEAAAHEADMAELNKALSAAKQDAMNANQQLDILQSKACMPLIASAPNIMHV